MTTETTLTTLLTTLTGGTATVLGEMGEIGATIVDTPMLALGLVFFFVGGLIGIFGRLLSRN